MIENEQKKIKIHKLELPTISFGSFQHLRHAKKVLTSSIQ